jgi:hypothetical protein
MKTPTQIDYTSRDYDALRNDLIRIIQARIPEWNGLDDSDFSTAIVDAFAYLGDIMSYYIDRVANESQLQTTTKKDNLINYADLFGYKPSGPTPSIANILFSNNTSNAVTLPAGTQAYISIILNDGTSTKAYFETLSSITVAANGTAIATAREGKTSNTDAANSTGIDPTTKQVLPKVIGTSNGYAYQEFTISNETNVVDYSIDVYSGQSSSFNKWTYFDNLMDATPFTTAYSTKMNGDGTTAIIFGDGINGTVPTAGDDISVIYKVSVGVAGNISSTSSTNYPNLVVSFIPGIGKIATGIAAKFDTTATGGTDGESFSTLRSNIVSAVSARNRAVTLADHKALASIVPGVGRVSVVSDVPTSVTMYMQPYYDGTLTPGVTLQTANASISAISGTSGIVTVTTSTAHGFVSGTTITITGCGAYNGTFPNIIVTDSTHFTYSSSITASVTPSSAVAANTLSVSNSAWTYIKRDLYRFLIKRMLVSSSLTINPPNYALLNLAMTVTINNSYKTSDVKAKIANVLLNTDNGVFSYGGFGFGDTVAQSIIQSAVMSVPGVNYVNITILARTGSTGASDLYLDLNEIPVLYPSNLTLNMVGGI